jgi:hypothetical protein
MGSLAGERRVVDDWRMVWADEAEKAAVDWIWRRRHHQLATMAVVVNTIIVLVVGRPIYQCVGWG